MAFYCKSSNLYRFLSNHSIIAPKTTYYRYEQSHLQQLKDEISQSQNESIIWFDNFSKYFRHSRHLQSSYSTFSWTAVACIRPTSPIQQSIPPNSQSFSSMIQLLTDSQIYRLKNTFQANLQLVNRYSMYVLQSIGTTSQPFNRHC